MTTKLDKPIRREIEIDEKPYTLTIDGEGLKLVEKGRRNGRELRWSELAGNEPSPSASPGSGMGG